MIIAAYQDLSIAHLSNQRNVRSSKTNVSKPYCSVRNKVAAPDNRLMDLQDSLLSLLFYKIKEST